MRIFFFLLITTQLAAQNTWNNFSSVYPAFSVDMPGEIQRKDRIVSTDIGAINITTYYSVSSVDSTENTLYLINSYELNDNLFSGDSAVSKDEYLSVMVDNIGEDMKAKEIYRNAFQDPESPGIIYRFENDHDGTAMKGKIIIRNKHLYSVQVFTTKQFALNKNMDRFINSFYLK